MSNKVLAIISYITIIGWLIAFFSRDKSQNNNLANYHLKQSLGLVIVSIIVNILLTIVVSIVPSLGFLLFFGYVFLIFMVLGIINANNEKRKPLPVIGTVFENKFSFID